MERSTARPGRTIVLVLLLLATCYFADWSDDNLSYNIAQINYAAGQQMRSVGGGTLNEAAMLSSFARNRASGKDSALETVFGSPLDGAQNQTGGSQMAFGGSSVSSDDQSDSALMRSRAGLGMSANTLGLGSANGMGIRGDAGSGFGLSGSSGLGLSGSAGFGASAIGAVGPF